MKPLSARLGSWSWILIYGGIFVFSVGVALQQQGRSYGVGVIATGALATAIGVVLIWVRSRMKDPALTPPLTETASKARHEHPRP